ncbi:MAG: FAD-dependent oxidoreductase [Clostridia bacterium]|nr:FAD-dependent oxidoreductase [Clostridia bacterium]
MTTDKILFDLENDFGDWFNGKFETPKMTKNLYPYKQLFSPIKINKLTVKNRIVMGPMGNINMAEETGRPNQKMIAYFEERARGGAGLLTTGLIPVCYGIDPTVKELGDLSYFPRIDRTRTVYSGWRDLAAGVHAHGSSIFVQLTAGLGRVGNPQCLLTQFKLPISASWNPNFYIPQIPCRRLSGGKIKKMVKNFGQAAADAKALNLDGVYLHGHEGYLMEQLSNPAYNRRTMGRYADWQAFGIDVVKQIRKRVGPSFPIMYRIDLSLALNATYQEKLNKIKGLKKFKYERTIEQTLDYMANLVDAGVDIFDVDLGCYDNWWLPHPPASMPSGCFLDIAKIVKDYFDKNEILSNAGEKVPVVAVGKLGYPDLAEQALKDEMCDMIMLARPLLADPEWPNKAYAGKVDKIVPCIGCHEACILEFVEGGHPQCAVNPRTAFEDIFSRDIEQATTSKKVAVIGAGPAGITAAKTLLERGHNVTLYEKNKIGGALIPASVPSFKYEMANYLEFLKGQVEELKKNKNFKLELGKEATTASLKAQSYDVILVATGSEKVNLDIPGIDNKNVINVNDAFLNPKMFDKAHNVVVIGGGDSGCEAAYWLSYELKKQVTIIEMQATLMTHSCTANRGHILHYLEKGGVVTHNLSKVQYIDNEKVKIVKNVHKSVPNPYNTWQPVLPENINNPLAPKIKQTLEEVDVKADIVVIATGIKANDSLYYQLVENNAAAEIYNIGDSFKPGKVFTATKSAYRKARSI